MDIRLKSSCNRFLAIVTPIYRLPLTLDEEISIRHLREYLGSADRYIVGLKRLPKTYADFELRSFELSYFQNIQSYSRLLVSKTFYRAFADYEYVLIYQPDCLVFSSDLDSWCRKGWDYVGAPWFKNPHDPSAGFLGVGNGGLSLRKVRSALEVLTSNQLLEAPATRARKTGRRSRRVHKCLDDFPQLSRLFVAGKALLHQYGYHNNVRWLAKQYTTPEMQEDFFWGFEASNIVKSFSIPTPREAMEFSFEVAPRYCFELNLQRLPFGCHAWAKYDREFWEPFLLK